MWGQGELMGHPGPSGDLSAASKPPAPIPAGLVHHPPTQAFHGADGRVGSFIHSHHLWECS